MLTEQDYITVAKALQIEVAVLKAVTEVESRGGGFFVTTRELAILFEPHVFWRELVKVGIDPAKIQNSTNRDILYQKWGTVPYPPVSRRWPQLNRAIQIHKEAAYASASYGMFQIMGFHAKS